MNDRQPLPPLPDLARTLYTAVLSDVLDEAGFMSQALKPFVRPLDETSVMCGFARTGLYRKVYHVEPGRNPYEIEMDLIDSLAPGEVAVLACDGPTDRIAPWGELLTTAASIRGAAGCLTDGLVRDVRRIREMRLSGLRRRHRPARFEGPGRDGGDGHRRRGRGRADRARRPRLRRRRRLRRDPEGGRAAGRGAARSRR